MLPEVLYRKCVIESMLLKVCYWKYVTGTMLPERHPVYLLTVADVDAERLDDDLVFELGVLFPDDAEDFRFRLRAVRAVCRLPVTQKQNHFV